MWLIGEVENSSRERAPVARVRFPPSSLIRWCALLKSSKRNETAVQCSSQFLAFNFTD